MGIKQVQVSSTNTNTIKNFSLIFTQLFLPVFPSQLAAKTY